MSTFVVLQQFQRDQVRGVTLGYVTPGDTKTRFHQQYDSLPKASADARALAQENPGTTIVVAELVKSFRLEGFVEKDLW